MPFFYKENKVGVCFRDSGCQNLLYFFIGMDLAAFFRKLPIVVKMQVSNLMKRLSRYTNFLKGELKK